MLLIIKYFIFIIVFSLPLAVLATNHCGPFTTICNPLAADNLIELIDDLADFLITVLSPIVVIMVLWSAFLFMTSGGNEKTIEQAKSTLKYAIIGAAILIVAKGIPTTIESFFTI